MSPGDAIDHPFLFPQADFKTGPMPSSSFLSWSDNGLIYEAVGGRPAAPGPTGDNRSVQLNHDRAHAIVSQSHKHTLHTHICKRADWVGSGQYAKLHDNTLLSWIWIHLGLQGAGSY